MIKYKNNEKNKAASFYPLLDRKGAIAGTEEHKQVQKQFDGLMKIIATNHRLYRGSGGRR